MNLKKKLYATIFVLLIGSGTVCNAQDLNWSQFYNTPTYYNPAYVGLTRGLKVRFNYQRQWTNVPAKFNAYSFSADIADRNLPGAGGIGIIFASDNAATGYVKNTMFGIMPSVRIQVEDNMVLQFGITAAFVQKRIDWDNLVFSDQLDPIQGNIYTSNFVAPDEDKVVYPDFSVGGVLEFTGNNNRLIGHVGAAVHHLTRPNESFIGKSAPLPRKYTVSFDMIFDLSQGTGINRKKTGFKLNPGIFFQSQAKMTDYALGMNIFFSRIYLGAWYKNESLEYDVYSHFSLMAGLSIPIQGDDSRVKFMYTYDMVINAEHTFTGPTHEITVIMEFDQLGLINNSPINARHRRGNERLECSPF
jgi:type IX secretion system PorP/SprF family membrane protein